MKLSRPAGVIAAMMLFGACGPCGGTSVTSSGNGCAHPGVCLTLSGPLSGSTSGLNEKPDCIPGGGLDAVFVTNVAGHETSIEVLVTDNSAKSSPGFHPGTFQVETKADASSDKPYASIWVKPDKFAAAPKGWSTDGDGSSGSVHIDADESGSVRDAVVAAAGGSVAALHVSGSFNCS